MHTNSRFETESGRVPLFRRLSAAPSAVIVITGLTAIGIGVTLRKENLVFLATTCVIYALFAVSTNISFGWAGLISFGQAAFFGAGGYTFALIATYYEMVPHVIILLVAMLVAGTMALLFGLVATKLTGVEFAMLTLVFGQILWLIVHRVKALGGESGLPGVRRGELFGLSLSSERVFFVASTLCVMVSFLFISKLRYSTLGLSLSAIRENPRKAASLGISVRPIRVLAFAISGMFAGLAGGLFTLHQGIASPNMLFWLLSGQVIVMCIFGGRMSLLGPAAGAVLMTVGQWSLKSVSTSSQLVFGLLLLVVVLMLPGGLASAVGPVRRALDRKAKSVIGFRGKDSPIA